MSEEFVGRMIRLAFLAPEVLEALVLKRRPPAISINEMVEVAKLPWGEQMGRVFGKGSGPSRISTITSPQTTRAVWPG